MEKEHFIETINTLRKGPSTYVYRTNPIVSESNPSFQAVCNFIIGYLIAIDQARGNRPITLVYQFSQWIWNKYGQHSFAFSGYIYLLLADENEKLAEEILLSDILLWVEEEW